MHLDMRAWELLGLLFLGRRGLANLDAWVVSRQLGSFRLAQGQELHQAAVKASH